MHALSIYFWLQSSNLVKDNYTLSTVNYEDELCRNETCSEQSHTEFAHQVKGSFKSWHFQTIIYK